jgi:hypothetical protein
MIHPTTSTCALATPLAQRRFRSSNAPPLLQRLARQRRACQRCMCDAAACATALSIKYAFFYIVLFNLIQIQIFIYYLYNNIFIFI